MQRIGLTVVQGNRMGHLLGPGISKGKALATLKRHLGAEHVKVLALGDSPNDLPLLEVADIAVVVPGPDGPHSALSSGIAAGVSSWRQPPMPADGMRLCAGFFGSRPSVVFGAMQKGLP